MRTKSLDDPEDNVKIEIAVVVEGYAESTEFAYAEAHRFQNKLSDLVQQEFSHCLNIALCQATCGDVEEEDG